MEVAYWFGGLFLVVIFVAFLRLRSRENAARRAAELAAAVERSRQRAEKESGHPAR